MSIVTVQIGQCGNQIGFDLYSTLINEYAKDTDTARRLKFRNYNEDSLDTFFEEVPQRSKQKCRYRARSVLVDMETKVVNGVADDAVRSGLWKYNEKSLVVAKRGAGNNWACGFQQAGTVLEEALVEALATQAEKCDRVSGFMLMSSLAGGTGSGLGSQLTSLTRDLYPHCLLLNQVTWPFQSGEVAVQSYNLILSLAHTYAHTDCLLSFKNDGVQKICQKNNSSPNVTFSDMNKHISKDISFLLSPSSSPSSASTSSFSSSALSADSLNDFVRHMCAHPDYKLCRVLSLQYSSEHMRQYNTYQWPSLLKQLEQQLHRSNNSNDLEWLARHNSKANSIDRSYAQMLVLRGSGLEGLSVESIKKQYMKIRNNCPAFNADAFAVCGHARSMFNDEKSGLLVCNDLSQMQQLDEVVEKAWHMFTSKAFLHQYQRYGLEEDQFLESFAFVEQLLSNYARL